MCINTVAGDLPPARCWVFQVWNITGAWRTKGISALTYKVSPCGSPTTVWTIRDRLSLTEKAHAKLIAGVVNRKCAPLADVLVYNMRDRVATPPYATDILRYISELEIVQVFFRVSQQSGVYNQYDVPTCGGRCANIESLVQVDNCLNLEKKNQHMLRMLHGGLNFDTTWVIEVKAEVQNISANCIGLVFIYPVHVKALHLVWTIK